ncbi:MAG TPA: YfhO family protein [Verrucomicrobiae bacterium]|nr:YfhO family protein [Verrucomicrobiae bacterium]
MTATESPAPAPVPVTGPVEWPRLAGFAAILGGLIVAFFPEVVLGLGTFCFRDFGHFAYPMAFHQRECFWRGEIPLWNPLNNCGIPFLAQWNTLVLYPPALFYLVFPLSWSLGVFCLLQLFWGGLGAYFLAHRWSGSRLGAAAAGIIFSLNGFSLNALMWPALTATLAWMPWVILCGARACRDGGRAIIIAALAGTLQMLTGTPEFILLTWLLLAAIVVICGWGTGTGRAILRLAGIVALVTGLSAAQLLPFLELLRDSQRDAAFGNAAWSMPVTGLANFLVPFFETYPTAHKVRLQFEQQWTSSYYLGAGSLALAMLAVWKIDQIRIRVLAAAAIASVVLALGDHGFIHPLARKFVPQLGLMRFPIKFVAVTVLCVPLLAAEGIAWMERGRRGRGDGALVMVTTVLAVLMGGIVVLNFLYAVHLEYKSLAPDTLYNGLARLLWLVLMTAAAIVIAQCAREGVDRRRAEMALLAFLAVDLLTHTPRQNPVLPRVAYTPKLAQIPNRPRPGVTRAMIAPGANQTLYFQPLPELGQDFLQKRLALFSNFNLLEDVAKVNGFFPLYLKNERAIWSLLYESTNRPSDGLLDFVGISAITSPTNYAAWAARPTAIPMVTAGQQPVVLPDKEVLARLDDAKFDPREIVYLAPESVSQTGETKSVRAHAELSRFTAEKLEASVDAPEPTVLVIAQSYSSSWRAAVDGAATPLLRANVAFQAVPVPAGKHQVTLTYRDDGFRLGVVMSLVTLAGCGVGWIMLRRRPQE